MSLAQPLLLAFVSLRCAYAAEPSNELYELRALVEAQAATIARLTEQLEAVPRRLEEATASSSPSCQVRVESGGQIHVGVGGVINVGGGANAASQVGATSAPPPPPPTVPACVAAQAYDLSTGVSQGYTATETSPFDFMKVTNTAPATWNFGASYFIVSVEMNQKMADWSTSVCNPLEWSLRDADNDVVMDYSTDLSTTDWPSGQLGTWLPFAVNQSNVRTMFFGDRAATNPPGCYPAFRNFMVVPMSEYDGRPIC